MDFEPWFTPDDAALKFHFMERAFECGENAISDWRDEHVESVVAILDGASLPARPKFSDDAVVMRHLEEGRVLEIENMHQAHRSSYVIMSFALFEASCTKFAELMLRQKNSAFGIRQISGSGLGRIKTVASAYGICIEAFGGKQWEEMVAYRELRNCLAHNAGLLEGDRVGSKLQTLIDNSHGLEIKAYGEAELRSIEMREFFVRHVIARLSHFTSSLANDLFDRDETECSS